MADCPVTSELACLCIGGQLDVTCCDDLFSYDTLKVTAELKGAGSLPVMDPTNCAQVIASKTTELIEGVTDGCWRTCDLKINKHDDPDMALQPSGTYYEIRVLGSTTGPDGTFNLLAGPYEVCLDGSEDYAAKGCCDEGDECINIFCLLDPLPTSPVTDRFCLAVEACWGGIGQAGIANVTGSFSDGYVVDVQCVDVVACVQGELDALQAQIDTNATNIAGNAGDIATNAADIITNAQTAQDCCDANAADIAQNTTDITQNATDIAALVDTQNTAVALTGDTTDGLTVTIDQGPGGSPVTANIPYADFCALVNTCAAADDDWVPSTDADGCLILTHPTDPASPLGPFCDDDDSTHTVAADGTITINLDSGETIVIPPGSTDCCVALTDNGDGTATVEVDNDGDGTADDICIFPTSIPKKCDGSDFAKGDEYTPLIQEDGHAPAIVTGSLDCDTDPDCAPALPDCVVEGMVTFDDEGITWQIQGGAWVAVAFTPRETRQTIPNANGGIDDAAIAALPITSPPTWVDIVCASRTFTNNDCVPVIIEADTRAVAQGNAEVAPNLWDIRLTDGPATSGFVNGMGSPGSIIDASVTSGQQKDLLWNKWFTNPIAPGDSVTLETCVQARALVYTSDVANSMDAVGMTTRFQIRRACN